MKHSEFPDPFEKARETKGFGEVDDQDDRVKMLLRLKDVRKTAKNWKTFQSGAAPGRIVVPSEVSIRDTRQIPFEVDPPMHTLYRGLVEDWFKRPEQPDYQEKLSKIINEVIDEVKDLDSVEVVEEFSLKLQSRALTLLLNIPYEESELWISWGTHVFRSEDSPVDGDKAAILYDYIDAQINKAIEHPSDDLYSVLLATEVEGRKMTKEEVKGVMILTFAGGRDTVINAVTNTISYFAEHPDSLARLKGNPEMTIHAVEELVRYFSPLTHMGRVVTEDTVVCEHATKADSRVSLCWASANRDPNTFENPNEVDIDRKINPHVGFGFGIHKCMGAPHARAILRNLIRILSERIASIDILEAKENIEDWQEFQRKVGFDSIIAKFNHK
ncbi:MAG: cytochrome P450 [Cyclobacteriaceae bacterium]